MTCSNHFTWRIRLAMPGKLLCVAAILGLGIAFCLPPVDASAADSASVVRANTTSRPTMGAVDPAQSAPSVSPSWREGGLLISTGSWTLAPNARPMLNEETVTVAAQIVPPPPPPDDTAYPGVIIYVNGDGFSQPEVQTAAGTVNLIIRNESGLAEGLRFAATVVATQTTPVPVPVPIDLGDGVAAPWQDVVSVVTLAEGQVNIVETGHPTWVCHLTVVANLPAGSEE